MYPRWRSACIIACLIIYQIEITEADNVSSTLLGTLSRVNENNDPNQYEAAKMSQKYIIEPIDNTADLNENVTIIYDDVRFGDDEAIATTQMVPIVNTTKQEGKLNKVNISNEVFDIKIEAKTQEDLNMLALQTTEVSLTDPDTTDFAQDLTTSKYSNYDKMKAQEIGESVEQNFTKHKLTDTIIDAEIDENEKFEADVQANHEESDVQPTNVTGIGRDELQLENRQYMGNLPPNRRKKPNRGSLNRPLKNTTFSGINRPTRKPFTTTPQPVAWYSNFFPTLPPLPQLPTLPPLTLPTMPPAFFGQYSPPALPNQTQPFFGLSYWFIPQNTTMPFIRPPWNFSLFSQNDNLDANFARHGLFFRPFINQSYFFHPFYKHLNKSAGLNTTTLTQNFGFKKHNHWNLTKSSLNLTNPNAQVLQIVLPYKKSKIQQQVVQADEEDEIEELVESEQIIELIDDDDEIIELIRRRRPKPKSKLRPQRTRVPQVIEVRRSNHNFDISNKLEPLIQLNDWPSERSNTELKRPSSETPKSIEEEPNSSSVLFEVQVPNPVYKFFKKVLQIFSR